MIFTFPNKEHLHKDLEDNTFGIQNAGKRPVLVSLSRDELIKVLEKPHYHIAKLIGSLVGFDA